MTIKQLKEIISNLPDDTVAMIEWSDLYEIKMATVIIHSDGRKHITFSAME